MRSFRRPVEVRDSHARDRFTGDRLKQVGASQRGRTILFTLAGLIAATAAWRTGQSIHLLYLAYLFCTFAIIQILATGFRIRLVTLILFLFFVFYAPGTTPSVPEVKESFTAETATVIKEGGNRSYRFRLAGLIERQRDCGPLQRADVYIQGRRLNLALTADHGVISNQTVTSFYEPLNLLYAQLDLASDLPTELSLSLTNLEHDPVKILRGPEIAGSRSYPDAVYLIFNTPKCVVVLHSQRLE
jgi:hypothetical protein